MFPAFGVLAIALGAPVDSTSSAYCFPESERVVRNHDALSVEKAEAPPLVVLEMANWPSHRVATRMGEILLREKLALRVRVFDYGQQDPPNTATAGGYQTGALRRLASGEVHFNVELWPNAICDFPVQKLHQSAQRRMRTFVPVAYELASRFSISREQMRQVLQTSNGSMYDAHNHGVAAAEVEEVEDDDFYRACSFLRAMSTGMPLARSCAAAAAAAADLADVADADDGTSLPGCWPHWVHRAIEQEGTAGQWLHTLPQGDERAHVQADASSHPDRKFDHGRGPPRRRRLALPLEAEFIAAGSGPIAGWNTSYGMIAAFILTAVYVFRRGDEGYTSGHANQTLPHLVRAVGRALMRGTRAGGSMTWNPASSTARVKPAAATASSVDGNASLGGAAHDSGTPTAQVSGGGGDGGRPPLTASVTLGRSLIIVSADDPYVAVPLIRLDDSSAPSAVLVTTADGRDGNAALRGRDYGALRAEPAGGGVDDGGEDSEDRCTCATIYPGGESGGNGTSLAVTFAPGARLMHCYIDLLRREQRVTGEHDCAELYVAIRAHTQCPNTQCPHTQCPHTQ